jgi:FAD/FMN-containing dehydrogenase
VARDLTSSTLVRDSADLAENALFPGRLPNLSTATLARLLGDVLPPDQISIDPRVRLSNSQDYAWFSNVLEADLGGCCADLVAWPRAIEELAGTLAAAYETGVPVTVRGGGTGNYGQCVPLRGGLIMNLSRMNHVLEVGDGFARVEPGVRFVDVDAAARASEQEIRIYPSTYLTATVAGFICGGSGGVGSVTHGVIADGNALGATVMGLTPAPRTSKIDARGMPQFIHAYGTTGILAEVTVPLAPRVEWSQLVCAFSDVHACHDFCLRLMDDQSIAKRLLSTVEPAISQHFRRSRLPFASDKTSVLLMVASSDVKAVKHLIVHQGGAVSFELPADSKTRLTDFSWNHTTLWAKKSGDDLTYLQVGFDITRFDDQVRAIKVEYGESFAIHGEYFRVGGRPFAAALPIIHYSGRADLDRMVGFLESIGIGVANPHRYVLEEGSRVENVEELLAAKREYDPKGLLNPGKLRAALGPGESAGHSFKAASMSLARRREV